MTSDDIADGKGLFILPHSGLTTANGLGSPCRFILPVCAGQTANYVFSQGITYTYDDVILHPGFIDFGANEVTSPALCCTPLIHTIRYCQILQKLEFDSAV